MPGCTSRCSGARGCWRPSCVPAAEEGIDRAMHRAGYTELNAYAEQLSTDPGALDDLLTELTIGETYFFRTHEHFDFLREHALPELRRLRGPEHTVRVWSAGCASGEEPYSLAVLLMEEGYGDRMEVLATDISRTALARAQEARYSAWSLRSELQAERMRPFLRPEGKRYVLAPEVRQTRALQLPQPRAGHVALAPQRASTSWTSSSAATSSSTSPAPPSRRWPAGSTRPRRRRLPRHRPFGSGAQWSGAARAHSPTQWGVAYRRPRASWTAASRPSLPPPPCPVVLPAAASARSAPLRLRPRSGARHMPASRAGTARQALDRGDWREAAPAGGPAGAQAPRRP